jgi:hypothetical protein
VPLCGPRSKHDPERTAHRHGQERRQLALGGRRVAVSKPRARTIHREELELRTYRAFAARELSTEAALGADAVRAQHAPLRGWPRVRWGRWSTAASPARPSPAASWPGLNASWLNSFGRYLSSLDLLAIFIDGVVWGRTASWSPWEQTRRVGSTRCAICLFAGARIGRTIFGGGV